MMIACMAAAGIVTCAAAGKDIPRDTSFALYNTTVKVQKKYPDARLIIPELPAGCTKQENVVYAHSGDRDLHLDIFSPRAKKSDRFPCILMIHGGGWRSGSRQMEWPMAQRLAGEGYVTVTVEYRLSIEAQYPAGVHDLKTAIRWLRANAAARHIDRSKIAVYGCSAGGQLAALLGTTGDMKLFEGDGAHQGTSTRVQCVVDVDGIVTFMDPADTLNDMDPAKPSASTLWFGGTVKQKPGVWKEASPIFYINKHTPPFLFVNSSLERYHRGRDEMVKTLGELGIYSEVHTIPDTPHPFWLFHPWFEPAYGHILAFLNKTLKN
jgi:pectinesterase